LRYSRVSVGNAIKYRRQLPPSFKSQRSFRGQWLFWVHDNGIGINPKDADRIFAIYQRLHTWKEYLVQGLVPAIASKIVERHGGRI
jgi:chemotaxis family two-component system sensor kinase Cph1